VSLQPTCAASHRAIGVVDYHPLSVRRSALPIKRMQRTVVHVSKLVCPPTASLGGITAWSAGVRDAVRN